MCVVVCCEKSKFPIEEKEKYFFKEEFGTNLDVKKCNKNEQTSYTYFCNPL